MAEFFDTNIQWQDDSAALLVGGRLFFAKPNTDPTVLANRITIFNDRKLSVVLPNPISLGPDGRSINKIWIGERYSFEAQNKNKVKVFGQPDQGEDTRTGVPIKLTNVQGTNAITAEASPAITAYVDQQIFTFEKVAGANTANVTLDIDGIGAKPIKFNFTEEIAPGLFQNTQTITIIYNSTTDSFNWIDTGRGISLLTNVAGDGNTITADGGPSVTGYVDGQTYQFKPNITNPGNVTLKVGTLPTHSIKSQGSEIPSGGLLINNVYQVTYNATGTVFELPRDFASPLLTPLDTNGFAINTSGFTVAS